MSIAETAHDRRQREEWRKAGTKQTRPLHQTANSEVCLLASDFVRAATEEEDALADAGADERGEKKR